jgi:mono/diheme cytochrome c family protein
MGGRQASRPGFQGSTRSSPRSPASGSPVSSCARLRSPRISSVSWAAAHRLRRSTAPRIRAPTAAVLRTGGNTAAAAREYQTNCAQCHGPDGRGLTDTSRGLKPQPPDLSACSLQPQRAFDVITNGYAGTAMAGYGSLPEGVRWGLVKALYQKRGAPTSAPVGDGGAGSH